ncbi:MAG: NAD(P)-dependent glycerol-3-phosphate dehydrogenase [Chloroflexi bacterium]|nr:NAD(P)-dependent glycerol-3-phosphate dehydrogenase [Chloroflexota bacterium]
MPGHVAVVNAGAWGTALAVVLASRGHAVRLLCRRAEAALELQTGRENRTYLPGVRLAADVLVTASVQEAIVGARAVLLAPISIAMRETARVVAPYLAADVPVLHATKGLELPSLSRLSEVVADELRRPAAGVAVLSGPTHAEEVGRGVPTAAVIACSDEVFAAGFQALLHGPRFRVYRSTDVVGVELCGALKNVVALATGALDGLGYGDNTRAALITRGLAEITRLVQAAGGDPRTVAGLAGLGDVIVTCTSRHSRNRWAGEQIGRGASVAEVLARTPQVIEGIPATTAALQLARRYRVEMPVCEQVDAVLRGEAPVGQAMDRLMSREPTAELR